jgi:hypothetical protein
MASKWPVVGSARRKGDGIEVAMVDGSTFAVRDIDCEALLMDRKTVALYQTSDISAPFRCGEARWSQSGRMVIFGTPGACKTGSVQCSGAHLRAHYRRGERRAVQVVRAPAPSNFPRGITLGVV